VQKHCILLSSMTDLNTSGQGYSSRYTIHVILDKLLISLDFLLFSRVKNKIFRVRKFVKQ
jgi:hypothetical protein